MAQHRGLVPRQPAVGAARARRQLPPRTHRPGLRSKRMNRKGIILAGGSGTRLYPITQAHQQAAAAGLRQADDLLPAQRADAGGHPRRADHQHAARAGAVPARCSATARSGACSIEYAVQPSPDGLAQAYLIGREFVAGQPSCLVLGDNIFYGHGLTAHAAARRRARRTARPCSATGCSDPERYGVAEFDADGRVIGLEEKPAKPRSNYAVTGLYFYDGRASDFAAAAEAVARAASWRSPTSTAATSRKARCTWSSSAAATPGSTPARTSRCCEAVELHRDDRGAPGPARVLPGGDRLEQRLDRRRAAATRWPGRWRRTATASTC